MSKLSYICIPLDGTTTELALPYTIYDSAEHTVVLKQFNEHDLAKAFRLKFEKKGTIVRKIIPLQPFGQFLEDSARSILLETNLQLCIIPKNGDRISESFRDRVSIGLECALGLFDECAAWVYEDKPSDVFQRRAYRSHSNTRIVRTLCGSEVHALRSILTYTESEYLPAHKFETLRALLNAARHQAIASDVACVLYFSVLEAIFVNDNKELSYKLAMRLARYKNEDFDYSKRIAKLYSKRGKVIHGSNKGNVFMREESLHIESLAKDAFVDIVANPESFTERTLDSQLLGSDSLENAN